MKMKKMLIMMSMIGLMGGASSVMAQNYAFRYPVFWNTGSDETNTGSDENSGEETQESNLTAPTDVVFNQDGNEISGNVGGSGKNTIYNESGNKIGETNSNSNGDFMSSLIPRVVSGDSIRIITEDDFKTIETIIKVPGGIGNSTPNCSAALRPGDVCTKNNEELVHGGIFQGKPLYVAKSDLVGGYKYADRGQSSSHGRYGVNSHTNGYANTNELVGVGNHRAALGCRAKGKDWYLPAIDQLVVLYNNRAAIGGFASVYYWSSTENKQTYAYSVNFANGSKASSIMKHFGQSVRCLHR